MPHLPARALLLSILALSSCHDTPPETPAATGLEDATGKRLAASLDRLAAALERMPAATPTATATPVVPMATERTAAPEGIAELAARIAALEQVWSTGSSRPQQALLSGPPGSVAPIQPAAVQSVVRMLRSEDRAAKAEGVRSLFGSTQQQVLQRLGLPTEVNLGNNPNIKWVYRIEDSYLEVIFRDGFVQHVGDS